MQDHHPPPKPTEQWVDPSVWTTTSAPTTAPAAPDAPDSATITGVDSVSEIPDNASAILDYLRESYSHSHPPQRNLERSATLYLPNSKIEHLVGVHQRPDKDDDELWLTIDFLDLPPKPKIPTSVRAGILSSDFNEKAPPSINTTALPQEMREARTWIDTKWKEWSDRTKQVESTQKLYADLFQAKQLLDVDRDSYELLWGFTPLEWGEIRTPLFTTPIEISVNKRTQQLQIRSTGESLRVETECYTGMPLRDAKGLDAFSTEIGDAGWNPWDSAALLDNSRQAIRFLHARGALKGEALPSDDAPLADPASWLLAIRPRSSDYLGFLDHLKTLYASGIEPTEPFAAIVATKWRCSAPDFSPVV